MSDKTMQPARRAYRLLWVLQGQTTNGLRLVQIAKALGCSSTVALRLLETADDEGIVERIPDKSEFWRLSPKIIQISFAHGDELQRLKNRYDELRDRYIRKPD
jgi:DNA-binding IclR family transcriptional regulator